MMKIIDYTNNRDLVCIQKGIEHISFISDDYVVKHNLIESFNKTYLEDVHESCVIKISVLALIPELKKGDIVRIITKNIYSNLHNTDRAKFTEEGTFEVVNITQEYIEKSCWQYSYMFKSI